MARAQKLPLSIRTAVELSIVLILNKLSFSVKVSNMGNLDSARRSRRAGFATSWRSSIVHTLVFIVGVMG